MHLGNIGFQSSLLLAVLCVWAGTLHSCVAGTAGDEGSRDIFSRLPSRRLHQTFNYRPPQQTGAGLGSINNQLTGGSVPYSAYRDHGGQYVPPQTVLLQQPTVQSNTVQQFVGSTPSLGPTFQQPQRGSFGTSLQTNTLGAGFGTNQFGSIQSTSPAASSTQVLPNFLAPPSSFEYTQGVQALAAASRDQKLDALHLYGEKIESDKKANVIEDLNFFEEVRKGLTRKKRWIQQDIVDELNRSSRNDVGQLTVQKSTNYAYQNGDDVVNVGTNQGIQKTLGPTPSSLSPEQLFQSGFQQGLNQGVLAGANSGFNAGFENGFQTGFENGFQQGLNQGVAGVADVFIPDDTDPAFQDGFQQGVQVGLNQGFSAGLAIREQMIDQQGSTGQKDSPDPSDNMREIEQEDLDILAQQALEQFLEDMRIVEQEQVSGQADLTPNDGNPDQQESEDMSQPETTPTDSNDVREQRDSEASSSNTVNEVEVVSPGVTEMRETVAQPPVGSLDEEAWDLIPAATLDQLVQEAMKKASETGTTDSQINIGATPLSEDVREEIIEAALGALRVSASGGEFSADIALLMQGEVEEVSSKIALDEELMAQIEAMLNEAAEGTTAGSAEPIWLVLEESAPTQDSPFVVRSQLQSNGKDVGDAITSTQKAQEKQEDSSAISEVETPDKSPKRREWIVAILFFAGVVLLGVVVFTGVFCCLRWRRQREAW